MSYMKAFLRDKGDLITIQRTPTVQFYASLKRSTRATYSLPSREHYFEGLCESESNLQGGEYFSSGSETFMVQTADPDRESGELAIFVVRTNAVIDIQRKSGSVNNNTGNITDTWPPSITSLPAYAEIATRSLKQMDEGLLDQAIYTFYVPSSKDIQKMDRVIYESEKYKVDSIDPTGMRGIVRLQVSPDFRP